MEAWRAIGEPIKSYRDLRWFPRKNIPIVGCVYPSGCFA